MKSYDIFNGVSQENEMVAAIVYSLNDYINLFGGTAVQYEDYLLNRANFLESLSLSNVVRIVDVPFSASGYSKWLNKKPYWKGSSEARSAWALDVAKDQKTLAALRAKHFLPGVPVGEETVSAPYYAVIPTLIGSDKDVKALGGKIPLPYINQIASEIREFFNTVPEFVQKSPIRCEGMRVFVGERIIAPRFADEVMMYFRSTLGNLLLTEANTFQLPKDCNTHQHFECLNTKNQVFSPVLLPVVLYGASSELDYCDAFIEKNEGFIGSASDIICNLVKNVLKVNLLDDEAVFIQGMRLDDFLEFFYNKIEIEVTQEHTRKKRNSILKRIK